MTTVLRRDRQGTDAERHTEGKATRGQRQRLEGWVYKPRDTKDCPQAPEPGEAWDRFSLRASRTNQRD